MTAIAGRLSVQVGWDRCAGANLVVVDSIAPLFDGQAVDPHAGLTAADALFIVGFGKVVVQYGEWLRARCNPAELTASDTVCHKVGINRRAKLVFSSSLLNVDRETYRAVRKCCKADGSKWTMRQAMTADECSRTETWLGSMDDIWKFVWRLRSVQTYRGEVGHPTTCGLRVV